MTSETEVFDRIYDALSGEKGQRCPQKSSPSASILGSVATLISSKRSPFR